MSEKNASSGKMDPDNYTWLRDCNFARERNHQTPKQNKTQRQ